MRKAVWIQQVLRIVRAANATRPHHNFAAGTDPQATFGVQQQGGQRENCDERKPEPQLFFCRRQGWAYFDEREYCKTDCGL